MDVIVCGAILSTKFSGNIATVTPKMTTQKKKHRMQIKFHLAFTSNPEKWSVSFDLGYRSHLEYFSLISVEQCVAFNKSGNVITSVRSRSHVRGTIEWI